MSHYLQRAGGYPKIAILLLSLCLSGAATAADTSSDELRPLENIARELVNIRQEIETLHNEINFEKEKYKDEMRSYASQKSDLGVRISRAELNIKDLQRELKVLAEKSKAKNQAQADVSPVLRSSISNIRSIVMTSLPFKLQQRLDALSEIESRLNNGVITPNKAANQLWAYVEDELMLGKSSGIYNDTISIGGQQKLVKVLRIGKVAMFYRTTDGEYGMTRFEKGQWQQQPLDDSDSIAQLDNLFDSFNKNIRNGQFEMPNFLPRS